MPALPPYPPPHVVVDYPPPPLRRIWFWVALTVSLVALVAGSIAAVAFVRLVDRDFPGQIDDPYLVSVIDEECGIMTSTVESLPITGSPLRQADTISLQNKAVRQLVRTVRDEAVGRDDDRPLQAWLDDWEALIAARESFAGGVADGFEDDLDIPLDPSGDAIYLRMDAIGACEVPIDLLNPYPVPDANV